MPMYGQAPCCWPISSLMSVPQPLHGADQCHSKPAAPSIPPSIGYKDWLLAPRKSSTRRSAGSGQALACLSAITPCNPAKPRPDLPPPAGCHAAFAVPHLMVVGVLYASPPQVFPLRVSFLVIILDIVG